MKTSIFGSYTEKCTTIDLKNFITISYLNNIYPLVDIIYLFICILYASNYHFRHCLQPGQLFNSLLKLSSLYTQHYTTVTLAGLPCRASNEPSRRLREVLQSRRRPLLGWLKALTRAFTFKALC